MGSWALQEPWRSGSRESCRSSGHTGLSPDCRFLISFSPPICLSSVLSIKDIIKTHANYGALIILFYISGTNLCSNGNGGCSHLCLAFPGGMACHCAHDHRLVNGKDCSSDPRCPEATKPCLSEDLCLPLEKFCNGVADCPDHSDENCEESPNLIPLAYV